MTQYTVTHNASLLVLTLNQIIMPTCKTELIRLLQKNSS